jgi:hypothetical protein
MINIRKTLGMTSASILLLALVGCSETDSTTAAPAAAPATLEAKLPFFDKVVPESIKSMPSYPDGKCAIDIINNPLKSDITKIKRSEGINIYGWALDDKKGIVPPSVILQLVMGKESFYAPLNRRNDREDLAKAFGKPEFSNAGFGATLDTTLLPVGQYDIFILQKGDESVMVCSTDRKLDLVD